MADENDDKQKEVKTARRAQSAGGKVMVFCKLPNGLTLRAFKMRKDYEAVMGQGSREVSIAEPIGQVTVYGVAHTFGSRPRTVITEAGYAITGGVDEDLWNAWLADNKDSTMIKNRLIYASKDRDSGEDEGSDYVSIRSGMEPFKQDKDPRAPRPRSGLSQPAPNAE